MIWTFWLLMAIVAVRFVYWLGKQQRMGLVEVCPRTIAPDGSFTGSDCRGPRLVRANPDVTCYQTHYWKVAGVSHECR